MIDIMSIIIIIIIIMITTTTITTIIIIMYDIVWLNIVWYSRSGSG